MAAGRSMACRRRTRRGHSCGRMPGATGGSTVQCLSRICGELCHVSCILDHSCALTKRVFHCARAVQDPHVLGSAGVRIFIRSVPSHENRFRVHTFVSSHIRRDQIASNSFKILATVYSKFPVWRRHSRQQGLRILSRLQPPSPPAFVSSPRLQLLQTAQQHHRTPPEPQKAATAVVVRPPPPHESCGPVL